MAEEGTYHVNVGDKTTQYGLIRKTTPSLTVGFSTVFGTYPFIVISPFWEGRGSDVGHAETIVERHTNRFVLSSGNHHPEDYYVTWIAVGPRYPSEEIESLVIEAGDVSFAASAVHKRSPGALPIDLGVDYAQPPNVQVSPVYKRGRGVSNVETITAVDRSQFITHSDNRDDDPFARGDGNYFVSWLATGPTTDDAAPGEFEVDGVRGRFGQEPKTSVKELRSFETEFERPPIVVVSPFFRGVATGVGYTESLNEVGTHYFEVASGNGAEDYFVSWIAIERRISS